jgi:cytoskeleton protein RodZ
MTEPGHEAAAIGTEAIAGASAGAMIRAAREKRGMHIAALAAAIKVPQRKLEALEADRYEELLDMTFVRALAQTVCRSLKIDAQPVLERLPLAPGAAPTKLQHVSNGLNTPFREGASGDGESRWVWLRRPVFWGTLLVLGAAAAVAWLPEGTLARWRGAVAAVPAAPSAVNAPAATAPAAAVVEAVTTPAVVSAPPVPAPATPAPAATSLGAPVEAAPVASAPAVALKPVGAALLGVKITSESWVEVQDARGATLVSRKVAAGEAFGLDGEVPLRVTIGNAAGAQLTFRGQPVDLGANTVANVARLQLN